MREERGCGNLRVMVSQIDVPTALFGLLFSCLKCHASQSDRIARTFGGLLEPLMLFVSEVSCLPPVDHQSVKRVVRPVWRLT